MERELIKVWRKSGYSLRLFDLGKRDSDGKWMLGYEFRDNRKLIFAGQDFHVGAGMCIDSLETVYSLLGFFAVQAGDTDAEYFESYTPQQLTWRDSSRCEELGYLVSDWEEAQERRRKYA